MSKDVHFPHAVALIALGAALTPAAEAIVSGFVEAMGARSSESETLYVAWLDMAESRIAAEQLLRTKSENGTASWALQAEPTGRTGEAELFQVITFFDRMGSLVASNSVDAGELATYLAGDCRHWADLLRGLRDRSQDVAGGARHDQLTRAISAIDLLFGGNVGRSSDLEFHSLQVARASAGVPQTDNVENVILVTGYIRNVGFVPNATHPVVATLTDAEGREVKRTLFNLTPTRLPVDGEVKFEGLVRSPPIDAVELALSFATQKDLVELLEPSNMALAELLLDEPIEGNGKGVPGLTCVSCSTSYYVSVAKFPSGGQPVRCAACAFSWFGVIDSNESIRAGGVARSDE